MVWQPASIARYNFWLIRQDNKPPIGGLREEE
jgi:hypothetical protein